MAKKNKKNFAGKKQTHNKTKSEGVNSLIRKADLEVMKYVEYAIVDQKKYQEDKRVLKAIQKANKKQFNSAPKKIAMQQDTIIRLRDLHKFFASKSLYTYVLKGIDIEIKRGEFVAILGKSGSGKTTLMNIMSGLMRATRGQILINGNNLSGLSNRELVKFRKENTGFVFQDYNLIPELTAFENAEIGANLQKKEKRLDIKTFYKNIEMDDQMHKFPSELSGGQQQRVSIARALTKNPVILFADEPTGALDEESTKQVFKLLREINQKYKTTIIMVTHNPPLVRNVDKIIRIKDGIVEKVIIKERGTL